MSIFFDMYSHYSHFMLTKNNSNPQLPFPVHRSMCTDCGVSRTDNPGRCSRACQFIKPDYPSLEQRVHGRARDEGVNPDEVFFGPFEQMVRASLTSPMPGAQWTGITSEIGRLLLLNNSVDAVVTVRGDSQDRWKPVPVLVTDPDDMESCRGMRMGYAPTLAVLEQAVREGYRRIALIGIPCQVYALRALEEELGLEQLFVIGTPCSDNTTTENFHTFLELLSDQPETITYLEFRPDYHVELRFDDGTVQEIPFLKLPISKLPEGFFPLTCQTCVDYTNALADITVGYMAGQGEQWLIVRNERGREMLSLLKDRLQLSNVGTSGNRTRHVKGFKANVERSTTGLPVRSIPQFLKPLVAWLMPRTGPSGLEFARARLEMKAIETVLHLSRKSPKRVKHMIPDHVWKLVQPYGLTRPPDQN